MKVRATMMLALGVLALGQSAQALSWIGNTRMTQSGGQLPYRGSFLEPWQQLDITTETWPINTGQRVFAVVTTNNWQSAQEYEFSWNGTAGNNNRWALRLPTFPQGSQVQFFLRAQRTGQTNSVFDSQGGNNFAFLQRFAPNYSDGPILQWFETDYRTIMARLPEVVNAGYSAIYLPAPSKGSGGGFSAGYDPTDRFDLGDRLQKGTVRTRFGTTQELFELIRVARRLGLEVISDLVVNHNANRSGHPIAGYPDMLPEDFHIRSSTDTGNNEINFNTESAFSFGMLNHELVGLVDIAHEDGNNVRTGTFTLPPYASFNIWGKPSFIRNATVPHLYPNGTPIAEDVRQYLDRWVRWMTGTVGFTGFRIDAVKHVPPGYFGWAPDQAASQAFSAGNLIPRTYSAFRDTYFFGEVYSSNTYELREYAKTGMNVLDFPLFFNMKNIFSQNGFADLSAAIANGYTSDASTGMFFQQGGLSPDVGVSFVQSHDDGPPTSNNLAHAFILGRPGRAKIYYDGNNIQPGNWTNFPRPGRFDALGNGGDTVINLVNANHRFGRGYHVNRWTSADIYAFERQVNGRGILLVALNDRSDRSETITVQTAFRPGTVLVDLSGQQPNVTVGSDARVTITVPSNGTANEPNNGRGYVYYAPQAPQPAGPNNGIELLSVNATGSATPVTFTTVNTPGGQFSSGRSFNAATVTSDRISLRIRTNNLGFSAIFKVNDGVGLNGLTPMSNTAEGLADGFMPMTKESAGQFKIDNLDISGLPEGLNVIRARVFADTGNDPGIFNDINVFFYIRRTTQGEVTVDGNLTDMGNPLVQQLAFPSSNTNRLDGLYVRNDDKFVYIGLAGRVDPAENLTNGFGLAIDVNGSASGVRNLADLNDDSGPAARLVSNTQINLPSNMAADYVVGVFRNRSTHAAPEAPFPGGIVDPSPIGAAAAAFRIITTNLRMLEPLRAAIVTQPRINRPDPARGAEIAIPIRSLFPAGIANGAGMNLVAWVGTTGERNEFLPPSDPNRALLGGRPAPESFVLNQFLPTQSNLTSNPGTGVANVQTSARYNLIVASPAPANRFSVSARPVAASGDRFRQVVAIQASRNGRVTEPVTLRIQVGNGVQVANASQMSAVFPSRFLVEVPATAFDANGTATVEIFYTGSNAATVPPSFELLSGPGAR